MENKLALMGGHPVDHIEGAAVPAAPSSDRGADAASADHQERLSADSR